MSGIESPRCARGKRQRTRLMGLGKSMMVCQSQRPISLGVQYTKVEHSKTVQTIVISLFAAIWDNFDKM